MGNKDLKEKYSKSQNFDSYLKKKQIFIEDLVSKTSDDEVINDNEINELQRAFGYTKEDISHFIEPIIKSGMEPIGSMGTDTPISLLSSKPKLLFSYFKQCFAQVPTHNRSNKRGIGNVFRCHFRGKAKYFQHPRQTKILDLSYNTQSWTTMR